MKTTFRFAQLFTRTGCPGPSTPSDFLSPISFFLLRSAYKIFFWLLSFTFKWWYHRNNDLKDAFFTDSRGDERVHMPIGLVKLFHIAETEPEQFFQPDCARGQCKNQCLCVQLTLLIVHLYLYLYLYCVSRASLLYFIRRWVALSFKALSQSVSESGMRDTCPDLHFVQYIKAWISSTDPVSSITNWYRLIVSYTDPVHSFIIS